MAKSKNQFSKQNENPIVTNPVWGIGDLIRYIREERGIPIHQLANGICSVPTLSRIESGVRNPDLITMEILLSRLGYTPQKFEMMGSRKEFALYDMRCQMRIHMQNRENHLLKPMLAEYENTLLRATRNAASMKENVLHWQLMKEVEAHLALCTGQIQEAAACLELAIGSTLPQWNCSWEHSCIVSSYELRILHTISQIYERLGDTKKSYAIRFRIWKYLESKQYKYDQMPDLYTKLICQIVPVFLNKGIPEKGIELCDNALKTLADTNHLFDWCDLLYWKSRCLEMMAEQGRVKPQDAARSYQRAYFSLRFMKRDEEAQAMRKHLEERAIWESI